LLILTGSPCCLPAPSAPAFDAPVSCSSLLHVHDCMGSGSSSASNHTRAHTHEHAHVSARSGAHVPSVQCVAVQATLQLSSSDLYDHSHAEQERASAISRVAALEARIKELEAENASLKGRAPAAPSACPVNTEQPPNVDGMDWQHSCALQ
jgi:hypothetical protein